jgi:UDP-glucose 4-epimerase
MMKTLLITGGAGYIGSHIGCLLAQHNYTIIVLDSLVYGQSFKYPWAKFIYGDFGDEQILNAIFTQYKIDAVIHCAASIEVGESVKNPLAFYENNVAKTIQLLRVMLNHHVKTILFSSSCAVFGVPKVLPLTENHSFDPISPYGMTKYMMESIIKDMHNAYGLSYVIFRFFNAAGAWPEQGLGEQHIPETHLIPLLLRAAHEHKSFTIFGDKKPTSDGSCIRDFVHVLDIANAHLLALSYLQHGGTSDIFNLGTGTGISVKEMISAVERICETHVQVVVADDRPGDPAILVADSGHVQKTLGWYARHSTVDEIVHTAYAYMCFKKIDINH